VPLSIDDGSDLTAEAIAETVPYTEDLALVVVDRLQAAHGARLTLSGDRLSAASQVLATLARSLHVPVLAVVDSSDPALLSLLDADVLLMLAPTADPFRVHVTIFERDFGVLGSVYLLHARFVDVPDSSGTDPAVVERRVCSPTTSSRASSSTTSSSPSSAKAPTDGSSPAPRTPSNSGNSMRNGPHTHSSKGMRTCPTPANPPALPLITVHHEAAAQAQHHVAGCARPRALHRPRPGQPALVHSESWWAPPAP
jgi:DnaB-like helicase C terminal domain